MDHQPGIGANGDAGAIGNRMGGPVIFDIERVESERFAQRNPVAIYPSLKTVLHKFAHKQADGKGGAVDRGKTE